MIKKNKWKLFLSSLVILSPIALGLFLGDALPGRMPTHWGVDGEIDGWSSRTLAIIGVPVFMLIMHWLCVFIAARDPKNKNQNNKMFGIVLWICPVTSLFSSGIIYAASLGGKFRADLLGLPLLGLMFVVIGNYLPKCKQNYTIGIRLKWTLENEENWNATHRVAGKAWVIGGLLMMASAFLPVAVLPWVLVISLTVLAAVPILYSYLFYRRQLEKGGAVYTPLPKTKASKAVSIAVTIFVAALLLFVGIMMFAGEIEVTYADTSFTVKSSFWEDLTVAYDAIGNIEFRFREGNDVGIRTFGLGSARLQAGSFHNDEFGDYTRYTYTRCDAWVVLTVEGKTLVISGADKESTEKIYDALVARKQGGS